MLLISLELNLAKKILRSFYSEWFKTIAIKKKAIPIALACNVKNNSFSSKNLRTPNKAAITAIAKTTIATPKKS